MSLKQLKRTVAGNLKITYIFTDNELLAEANPKSTP